MSPPYLTSDLQKVANRKTLFGYFFYDLQAQLTTNQRVSNYIHSSGIPFIKYALLWGNCELFYLPHISVLYFPQPLNQL